MACRSSNYSRRIPGNIHVEHVGRLIKLWLFITTSAIPSKVLWAVLAAVLSLALACPTTHQRVPCPSRAGQQGSRRGWSHQDGSIAMARVRCGHTE